MSSRTIRVVSNVEFGWQDPKVVGRWCRAENGEFAVLCGRVNETQQQERTLG